MEAQMSKPERTLSQGITLSAVVLGEQYEFLIDTGAMYSIIYLSKTDNIQMKPWLGGSLQSASMHEIKVKGIITGEVKIGSQRLEAELLVVQQPIRPILGIDFLRRHKITLDLGNNTLITPEVKLQNPLATMEDVHSDIQPRTIAIRATEDVKLESQQIYFIKGTPNENLENCTSCLIEPTQYTMGSLRTMRSISNIADEHMVGSNHSKLRR